MDKIQSLDLKENTKKVYVAVMNRLLKEGFQPEKSKYKKISGIKKFLEKFEKPSTKLDLLNVILLINDDEKLRDDIKKYRTSLQKIKNEGNIKVMRDKGASLISVDAFKSKLDILLNTEKYNAYIPNYLMFHFGVRNEDVNVVIMKAKAKKHFSIAGRNNLILFKDKVLYIRQNYKTFKTFGRQEHTITDKDFIKAVSNATLVEGTSDLFSKEQQLGNQLRKVLINRMTESDIFKMLIDDAYHKKDTARINELSQSRGTAIQTIKQNYDVNAKEEIIKEL